MEGSRGIEPAQAPLLGPDGQPYRHAKEFSASESVITHVQNLGGRLKDVGILLTVSGLLMYALIRSAYALFYGRLGVEPEEVGLGYAEVLAQSLVGILVFAILVGTLLITLFLSWRLVLVPSITLGIMFHRSLNLSRRTFLFFYFLLLVLQSVIVFILIMRFEPAAYLVVPLYAFLPGFAIGDALARQGSLEDSAFKLANERARDLSQGFGLTVRNLVPFGLGIGFLLIFELLFINAPFDANAVKSGNSLAGTKIRVIQLPVLRNRAELARVWFRQEAPAWIARECLMYLGQSDGTTVLYAVRSHRALRIPSSDVSLSLDQDADSCPEERPIGESIVVEDSRAGTRTRVVVTRVTQQVNAVTLVSLQVRNLGNARLDESLLGNAVLTDDAGKRYQPAIARKNGNGQRIRIEPRNTWKGSVSFQLPRASTATLFEFTLSDGRGSDTGQWDLSRTSNAP